MPKLTAAFVRGVTKPGKYGDQHGLILRVQPSGSKAVDLAGNRQQASDVTSAWAATHM